MPNFSSEGAVSRQRGENKLLCTAGEHERQGKLNQAQRRKEKICCSHHIQWEVKRGCRHTLLPCSTTRASEPNLRVQRMLWEITCYSVLLRHSVKADHLALRESGGKLRKRSLHLLIAWKSARSVSTENAGGKTNIRMVLCGGWVLNCTVKIWFVNVEYLLLLFYSSSNTHHPFLF